MKKDDILKSALALLGVSEDDVNRIVASEEVVTDFTMPTGTFFTSSDLEARDSAIKGKAKAEGGTAAVEIAIKNARNELGLEFEGKTMANLIKAHEAKIKADAKIEPDKRVQELTAANEALRGQITAFDAEKEEMKGKLEGQKLNYEFSKVVGSGLADVTLKDGWNAGYVSQVFSNDYEPAFEDNKIILKYKATGEKVLNAKTQLPEAPEAVLKAFVMEKGLVGEARKGRGVGKQKAGNSSSFAGIEDLDGFISYCEEHEINPEGAEGSKLLSTIQKENKNFKVG